MPASRSGSPPKYPWIRLLFVPARCTPVAQPMDAGIIAKIKGLLRKLYGAWVVFLTQEQLKKGTKPEEIKVPAAPIARGTLCPGHVLVPWAHSPIWSRQHPIFVSLIQIAYYKR